MSIYYISADGNDKNSGLSPKDSWQSLENIKHFVRGGDTVKLRAGDKFFGRIEIPPSDDEKRKTVIESYGEGAKPCISRYKIITQLSSWEKHGENIWRAGMQSCLGDKSSDGSNVGFIRVGEENHGFKKFSLSDVKKQWDFYSSPDGVYVYSDKNPCEYADAIYIAAAGGAVLLGCNTRIENIDIYGGGSHGVTGSVKNAEIVRCDIHDFGGSHLTTDERPEIRFGNGIELWSDAENVLVEGCRIYNIYDVAFTMQGFPQNGGWKNIVFKNNILWNNQQSFEIWTQDEKRGSGLRECVFENNICLNAGYCWSFDSRPDKINAVHLLMYALECEYHDVTIRKNIFYNPKESLYYSATGRIPDDYKSNGNVIFMKDGQKLINGDSNLTFDKREEFFGKYNKETCSEFFKIK